MGEYEGEKESWNMATATMKRLNGLLMMSSAYAQQKDFNKWHTVLMDLRRNLAPFLEKDDFDKSTELLSGLPADWRLRAGGVNPKCYANVHKAFDETYILFIKCMKSKGLLMPTPLDTGKSMTQM